MSNNKRTSLFTSIKAKLYSVKSTMSSWYRKVFPVSNIETELATVKTKLQLSLAREFSKDRTILSCIQQRDKDEASIQDYFTQLKKAKKENKTILHEANQRYENVIQKYKESLAELSNEKDNLEVVLTNLEVELATVKENNQELHTIVSSSDTDKLTLSILKEREAELELANKKVKDLEDELNILNSKDQSNVINYYTEKEESLKADNIELKKVLRENETEHKKELAALDIHIAKLSEEHALLTATNNRLISIPTDTKYLANKSTMKVVLDKLEIMYSSLRSIEEYSRNYTTDIVKSIDKYKSTTLDLVTIESQYKETKALLEMTIASDNTHGNIKNLQIRLNNLEEKRLAHIETLKRYELENDTRYNFKRPEESEYMITFCTECATFEHYLENTRIIVENGETYDKLAYEKQFKSLKLMRDKLNEDKARFDKDKQSLELEVTTLRNQQLAHDDKIKELEATTQRNQEIQQAEIVNLLADKEQAETSSDMITKLKGELLVKDNLYKTEISKLKAEKTRLTKAKEKLLDEYNNDTDTNLKATTDLHARLKSLESLLENQEKLRHELFDLEAKNEVYSNENKFLIDNYSKASLLIQHLANTYARDSHIVAHKAKVNAEMLLLENQIQHIAKDNPKRIELVNYLSLLKRSNTFTSGLISGALSTHYTERAHSDNESSSSSGKIYLTSNTAKYANTTEKATTSKFLVRNKDIREPVNVNSLSNTVQNSTSTSTNIYQPNNNNNNNDQVYLGDN
jgi:hypothetical protein